MSREQRRNAINAAEEKENLAKEKETKKEKETEEETKKETKKEKKERETSERVYSF